MKRAAFFHFCASSLVFAAPGVVAAMGIEPSAQTSESPQTVAEPADDDEGEKKTLEEQLRQLAVGQPNFPVVETGVSIMLLTEPRYEWVRKSVQSTGEEVRPKDYGWQLGLAVRGATRRCGAILISQSYILTAAHCVDRKAVTEPGRADPLQVSEMQVFASSRLFGETPLELDESWHARIHEDYKNEGPRYSYDAAILRLARPLVMTAAPVSKRTFATGKAVTSGWGDHPSGQNGILRGETVPIVDADLCRDQLRPEDRLMIGPMTICTVDEAVDACARDSGGPLVIGTRDKPQTVGIVSWGSSRCGVPGPTGQLLGGYTRTSVLADWILRETGDPLTVTDRAPGRLMAVATVNDR